MKVNVLQQSHPLSKKRFMSPFCSSDSNLNDYLPLRSISRMQRRTIGGTRAAESVAWNAMSTPKVVKRRDNLPERKNESGMQFLPLILFRYNADDDVVVLLLRLVFFVLSSSSCLLLLFFFFLSSSSCLLLLVFFFLSSSSCLLLLLVFFFLSSSSCLLLLLVFFLLSSSCPLLLLLFLLVIVVDFGTFLTGTSRQPVGLETFFVRGESAGVALEALKEKMLIAIAALRRRLQPMEIVRFGVL